MEKNFNPKLIDEISYTRGKKCKYILKKDLSILIDYELGFYDFFDQSGNLRMSFVGKYIIIRKGYAWDGSSPKVCIFGKFIGTPDFKETMVGTCVHDALYQFLHTPCLKLKRLECDNLFEEILLDQGFGKMSYVYSYSVKLLAGLTYKIGTWQGVRTGYCKKII
jgi:hypothetical protein